MAIAPDWAGPGPGPKRRPSWSPSKVSLATSPDGAIVVSRGNLLLRYLPDGRLDADFGEGGRLMLSEVDGLPFGVEDVAVDGGGNIMVFGTTVDPSVQRTISSYSITEVAASYATVLRLDVTGERDRSFGDGDGIFREGLGLRPTAGVPGDISLVEVVSARLDSKGRPLIALAKIGFPPTEAHTYVGWVADSLLRLTPAGERDRSFGGGDGVIEAVIPRNRAEVLADFCVSTDDEPIVASREFITAEEVVAGGRSRGKLIRFRADGGRDRSFGRAGVAHASRGVGPLACAPSGKVFALQGPDAFFYPPRANFSSWRVVRRSPGGGVDRGFTRRATVRLGGGYSRLSWLSVDRRGRVLLAGTLSLPKRGKKGRRSFFAVIRLHRSGSLDRRFGHRGWVRTGFGPSATVTAEGAAIDGSGNLVVAGNGRAAWLQPGGVVLARYLKR